MIIIDLSIIEIIRLNCKFISNVILPSDPKW
jgi:hypothetical protein